MLFLIDGFGTDFEDIILDMAFTTELIPQL